MNKKIIKIKTLTIIASAAFVSTAAAHTNIYVNNCSKSKHQVKVVSFSDNVHLTSESDHTIDPGDEARSHCSTGKCILYFYSDGLKEKKTTHDPEFYVYVDENHNLYIEETDSVCS